MLVSSTKFQSKAEEVKDTLKLEIVQKHLSSGSTEVEFYNSQESCGMMLYTSGTTSRPVCLSIDELC